MQNNTFKSEKESLQFYEDRYHQGYMEDWDPEKKKRVTQIIRELNLPSRGRALDFGCGNGVLTQVIRKALPGWDVYGCDVSEIAVANAETKLPHLNFFFHDGNSKPAQHFDLIFSHHVFEHVYDMNKSWNELAQYGGHNSIIINILPCGNKNSFEYKYCLLLKNGINKTMDNRFFFEDHGHLRRMTTEDMEGFAKKNNYHLFKSYYANQYYGALNWISKSGDAFVEELTDTADAVNETSKRKILSIRKKIKFLMWVNACGDQSVRPELKLIFQRFSFGAMFRLLSLLYARCVKGYYHKMTNLEWKYFKHRRNGSEMFLFFKKVNGNV